jgi:hypothetical protein
MEAIIRFYNIVKQEFISVSIEKILKKVSLKMPAVNNKDSHKRYRYIICAEDDDGIVMNKHCTKEEWEIFDRIGISKNRVP